jgi:hypothetical protein
VLGECLFTFSAVRESRDVTSCLLPLSPLFADPQIVVDDGLRLRSQRGEWGEVKAENYHIRMKVPETAL